MKLALEALESDPISHAGLVNRKQAITALRQALETEQKNAVSPGKGTGFNYFHASAITVLRPALETKQEPVALPCCGYTNIVENWTPIYTAPPKQWVGLTDEEIGEVISGQFAERNYWVKITKALEAKLKEKNT